MVVRGTYPAPHGPARARASQPVVPPAAGCALVIGLMFVHKGQGQSPIPASSVGEWYRDTIFALIVGVVAAVAASLSLGLRRPIVTPLAIPPALMILVGIGGLVLPRDPLMPVAIWPAIVASALALLVLALPFVPHRLPE